MNARDLIRHADDLTRDADAAEKAAELLTNFLFDAVNVGTYRIYDRKHRAVMAEALKAHAATQRAAAAELEGRVTVL